MEMLRLGNKVRSHRPFRKASTIYGRENCIAAQSGRSQNFEKGGGGGSVETYNYDSRGV